ncbi:16S rRNA (guanine(527)-N(7))-methyltransferase RsmG [soil metagenome]
MLASDPRSLSSVRDPAEAWHAHVADSLTGLEVPALRKATRIADVGAGAGFPGFVLAAVLPGAQVTMIESVARKCDFMREAAREAGFDNVSIVNARSEEHAMAGGDGREAYDVVTARAVARLSTLAELASPLLNAGGSLVAWKGRRDPDEENEAVRAAERTAMQSAEVIEVGERAGFEHRHLHVFHKVRATPDELPRRPGVAKRKPFGA